MKAIAFSFDGLWWVPVIAGVILLMVWQRRRLRLTALRLTGFGMLLLALLNPIVMVRPGISDRADFNLQVTRPHILLAEYGGGKTYLGTVLGAGSSNNVDVVSPDNLSLVSDMLNRYDTVVMHTGKNLQVYIDYFTDWKSFPNRGKLESVFADYGVVFDSGTNTLPQNLNDYGLVVLASSDVKAEDVDRLLEYTRNGGRLLILFHAGGGLAVNPPGNDNPYCILYHHPPYGDVPFPADWLQRNVASMLRDRLGVRSMEDIACIYGDMVVHKSDLSSLHLIYPDGSLYPSANIDGANFDKLDWTTAFLDYDPAWQPLMTIDIKISGEPTGHGTPITVPVDGKPVGMVRQYGDGRVFIFGWGPVNYGRNGFTPSLLLTAAPYIGADVTYDDVASRALMSYVAAGGNVVIVGPSTPRSTGATKLTDVLPVTISGPQVSEATRAVFRNPGHPLLSGLSPFAVSHYRVSSGKASAEVLAADGKNNPVLVASYYGSGRVVYYLPEIPVQATADNMPPPEFWTRLLYWLSPPYADVPGFNPKLPVRAGNDVPVSLRLWDDGGNPVQKAGVSVNYRSAEGKSGSLPLKETSPGVYAGLLPLSKEGDYGIDFEVKAGPTIGTQQVVVPVSASATGFIEKAAWKAISFLDGYQGAPPFVLPLPLWQLLALCGVTLLCIDWSRSVFKGHL
ncbi:MAG: hypothetical protein HYX87_03580 [Chloroflexi bacterium]|nr:hypothetical protein [Chloroflexota bacterium]